MGALKPRTQRIHKTDKDELNFVRRERDKLAMENDEIIAKLKSRRKLLFGLLAITAWISVFSLVWLIVFVILASSGVVQLASVFFLLVAISASGIYYFDASWDI